MFLRMRTVWLLAAGAVPVLAWPRPLTVGIWVLVVLTAVAVDVILAPSPRELRAERRVSRSVRLGQSTTDTLTLHNPTARTFHVELRDAWVPSAGAVGERATVSLPPGQRRRHRTTLTPTRRGDRQADLVTVRSRGPLGLAGRQASLSCPARLRVLPAFSSRRHLPSRLARLRELDGRSAVMVRGAGTEFDSLREYVVGDDVRSIDWRSTARRGDVVVRTWRPERDRRVLIVVDTGRLAAARLGDAPRLEAQIEAALLLAALATHAGDRVSILAMDTRVRARLSGQAGPALMSALAQALAPLDSELTETDWRTVSATVRQALPQRALVVVLAGLDGAGVGMTRALAPLAREHTLLVASATDPDLEVLRSRHSTAEEVYVAAAAQAEQHERDRVAELLQRAGAKVVQSDPDALAPSLADAYLALKAAGRL